MSEGSRRREVLRAVRTLDRNEAVRALRDAEEALSRARRDLEGVRERLREARPSTLRVGAAVSAAALEAGLLDAKERRAKRIELAELEDRLAVAERSAAERAAAARDALAAAIRALGAVVDEDGSGP